MNRFTPAYRQLARALARLARRCGVLLARRKLARLESELGLLGWQQADYSEATQQQVRKLADYEREQARLTNESAELGLELQDLRERRAKEKAEFTESQAKFKANYSELNRPVQGLEQRIAKRRNTLALAERAVADMETKLGFVEPKPENARTPEERAEMLRFKPFREIPGKLKAARAKVAGIKEEMQCEERDMNLNLPVLKALEERLSENRARFDTQDSALQKEITAKERAKRKLEKEINALEKAKSHPYREIGRVLADNQIAPINQPKALEEVHAQRRQIAALESLIETSLAEGRAQPRDAILISWQWWVAVLGAVFLLWLAGWVVMEIISVLPHRH